MFPQFAALLKSFRLFVAPDQVMLAPKLMLTDASKLRNAARAGRATRRTREFSFIESRNWGGLDCWGKTWLRTRFRGPRIAYGAKV